MNRRHFLGLALSVVAMPILAKRQKYQPRILLLYHVHTGEEIEIAYRIGDSYQHDALKKLNDFMRDHWTNEVIAIDPHLFDLLFELDQALSYSMEPINVLSAYRSPRTNARLRRNSRLVARNSLHMQGKAVDIYIPGVSARRVKNSAIRLRRGGVGFYPKSKFVHVDTGVVRHWAY